MARFPRFAFIFFAIIAIFIIADKTLAAPTADFSFAVDGVIGDDASAAALACSSGATFRTINAAVGCALQHKKNNLSSQIIVQPGTYRETVDLWLNPAQHINNLTPITVEAATGQAGNVIVSGSDLVGGWSALGGGLYTATVGAYPLTISPQLTGVDPIYQMPDLTRRREMLFADGQWLRQVLTGTPLSAGQFSVDTATGTVTIAPHDGVLDNPNVEVAIRSVVWKQNWVNNISVRGLVFQHAATAWENGRAAVAIGGSRNFTLTDSRIVWNNGDGLFIGEANGDNTSGTIVQRTVMNRNGKGGINTAKVVGLQVLESETSFNNWRGQIGGYFSWWVGNKFTFSRGLLLEDHLSLGNQSRGIWFDLDNEDVTLRRVRSEGNLLDGIFLEVSQGPFLIEDSDFIGNERFGVMGANAEQVTLDNVRIVDNLQDQIRLTADFADGPRDQVNHTTGETMTLWLQSWTIRNSVIGSDGGSGFLAQSTLVDDADGDDWTLFQGSYSAENNCWYHTTATDVFKIADPLTIPSQLTDFAGWQTETGQEATSVFRESAEFCQSALVAFALAPPLIDGTVDATWSTAIAYDVKQTLVGGAASSADLSATFRTLYDDDYLYVLVEVSDDLLVNDSVALNPLEWWKDDSIELFIDGAHDAGNSYNGDDFQLVFSADNNFYLGANSAFNPNPAYSVVTTANGYTLEAAIPLTVGIMPVVGTRFGFDVHINDDDNGGTRDTKYSWHAPTDTSWTDPATFGDAVLLDQPLLTTVTVSQTAATTPIVHPTIWFAAALIAVGLSPRLLRLIIRA